MSVENVSFGGGPAGLRAARGHRAFTLVELLVVLAVIAMLAALLLPALSKGKSRALNVACINNLSQLQKCLALYVNDYDDLMAPNNSVIGVDPGTQTSDSYIAQGVSWSPDLARTDVGGSNLVQGLLYPYNSSIGIYHCPADKSTLESPGGAPLPQSRYRSYNLSQSINGYPEFNAYIDATVPCWKTYSGILTPSASSLFTFLDENSDSIIDSQFGNPPAGSWADGYWWDQPSDRHGQAGNLAFADGHVEHWKWDVPKVFTSYVQWVPPQELGDYHRIQHAMKQFTDN